MSKKGAAAKRSAKTKNAKRHLPYDVKARDIPRELFPYGRIRFSLGTSHVPTAKRYRATLNNLRRQGNYDVLKAIADDIITLSDVVQIIENKNKNEIEQLREIRDRIGNGRLDLKIPTLNERVEKYLAWYKKKRSANSYGSVAPVIRKVCRFVPTENGDEAGCTLGERLIDRVSAQELDEAISAQGQPSYQATIRKYMSGVFRWAIETERDEARTQRRAPRLHYNPAKHVEIPTGVVAEKIKVIDPREVRRLLSNAEPYQLAFLIPMLHVGFRDGEIIHTRLARDLDLQTWIWKIQARGPDLEICGCPPCAKDGWRPKSQRGDRKLLIPEEPAELRQSILTYLALYPCNEGDYVFRNPRTGGPWHQWSLEADFKRLCRKAKVTYGRDIPGGITLHCWRHTCATNLLRQGVRESVVAGILGDSVDVVVRYYIHLDKTDLAEGIARSPSYL